jgi:hypothetical protein
VLDHLTDARERVHELDRNLDGQAVARALATDLGGRHRPLRERTDPAVARLRHELIDVLVQPRQLTGTGRPSPAAQRRARRCHLTFDEGYLVGRIGLDTHRLALRWSGLPDEPDGPVPAPAAAGLAALRSLVLCPALASAFAATRRLAPLVRDLTDDTRGIPADQAAQFAGFGLLTSVAEWTVLVGGHDHRVELLQAGC